MLNKLCAPALIYIAFCLTQIIIDIFKEMYNTAFLKFIVMIIFTLILNILCSRNLNIIAWFIVFIPFIMMTIITSILLYVFNLSPSSGDLNYNVDYPSNTNNPNNKNVVVVTNNGINQPYENQQQVEPGTYNNQPTADEVNNYNNVSK